jgi:hypothetical protein
MPRFYISPSDLAWLSDSCRACWWRKIHGIQGVKQSMPGIFNTIDAGMKTIGMASLAELGIPALEPIPKSKVLSAPWSTPELAGIEFVVSGYLDKLVRLDDDTYGILDFKSGAPGERNGPRYSRQLHGYELALRMPASGEPRQVTRLWNVYFTPAPTGTFRTKGTAASLMGTLTPVEVPLDRFGFESGYLTELARAAVGGEPPAGEWCEFCACLRAVEQMRRTA